MSKIRRGRNPEETPTDREKRELFDVVDPVIEEIVQTEAEHRSGRPIARKGELDALRKNLADIATSEHPEKSFKEIHYDLVRDGVIELLENELESGSSSTFFHRKEYLDYFEGAAQMSGEGWTAADLMHRLGEDPDIQQMIQDGLKREQEASFNHVIQSLLETEPSIDLEYMRSEARARLDKMGVSIPNFDEAFDRNLSENGLIEYLTTNIFEGIVNEEVRTYAETALQKESPVDILRDIGKEIELILPALSVEHEKVLMFVIRKKIETWLKSEIERGRTDVSEHDVERTFLEFIRSYEMTESDGIRHVEKMDLLRRLHRLVFEAYVGFEGNELAPFAYDTDKAKEYGFSEMKIEAHPEAQKIVDAIYARDSRFVTTHLTGSPDPDSTTQPPATLTVDKYKLNEVTLKQAWNKECHDLPNTPEKSLWYFQALAEHRLSNTIDNDDPHNLTTPHIPSFGQKAFLLAMDFQEFDWDNATDKQAALTPQTKKILKTLFGTQDPTNITRDEVNTALWSDHDNRIQSNKAKQVIRELLGPSESPDDYELRLLRPDEYQRAATSQGYGQKNLWTHMDGYYAHGDGPRCGLDGGRRADGGAADVGGGHRGSRGGGLSVRLVLSRKK